MSIIEKAYMKVNGGCDSIACDAVLGCAVRCYAPFYAMLCYAMLCNARYDFPGSNSGIDMHALTGWIPEQA